MTASGVQPAIMELLAQGPLPSLSEERNDPSRSLSEERSDETKRLALPPRYLDVEINPRAR
ncbi:MAG TPA: hypothetical protein VN107_02030 [Microbacterium sp.]|nr:hypothetical protein [Microbacterium sp.]